MLGRIDRQMLAAGPEACYDANAKMLLSEKIILAHILAGCVEEFADMDPQVILGYIEGEPEISSVPVEPGMTNSPHIRGISTEDRVPYEQVVFYDIRFYVRNPKVDENVGIVIGIEAQKSFYPGYDLVTRGIYYAARMISSQMGVEFTGENYNQIKKVYSIWICMRVPRKIENTITEFAVKQNNIVGTHGELGRYDLFRCIFVCLSDEMTGQREEVRLHRLLETLFADGISLSERRNILQTEYQITMTEELEGRLNQMCNLGEGLAERWMERGWKEGMEKGMRQGIQQGMQQGMQEGVQQTRTIFRLFMNGEPESMIAEKTGKSEQEIHDILYGSEEA